MPKIGPVPGNVADAVRVRIMLDHVARTLLVASKDCFDPAIALCLSGEGRPAPRRP